MTDDFLRFSKWIQWIADRLFDQRKYLVFIPWCQRIGHLTIEILAAASVAKRDRKKLILIPHFRTVNKDIFACNFNCDTYRRKDIRFWFLHKLTLMSGICNWLYNACRNRAVKYIPVISKVLPSIFFYPRIGIEKGRWWRHRIRGTSYYHDFDLLMSQNIKASLTSQQLEKANEIIEKMGLPQDAWFVSIHVRGHGYLGLAPAYDHRSINILNYIPAIECITEKGGYVVRLGDASMTPLPRITGVIDYAVSEYRSGLMDLYLVSKCKFFLGCDSGPMNYAKFFDKLLCTVNFADFDLSFYRENDVKVPKHIFSKKHGRILSFKEVIESDIFIEGPPYNNYIFLENTPEEISRTVVEFFGLIEDQNVEDWNLPLQEEIRSIIRRKYLSYIGNTKIDDGRKEYWAGRVNGKGMIGKYYLENCWSYGNYLEELTAQFLDSNVLRL